MELADVGRIFGQNNVASELPRSEPEGKVWNFVELKFRMNSAGGNTANDYMKLLFFTILPMQGPSSPEHDVIIKIVAGTHAGDGALRRKTRLNEGSRMEHAQQGVNEDL